MLDRAASQASPQRLVMVGSAEGNGEVARGCAKLRWVSKGVSREEVRISKRVCSSRMFGRNGRTQCTQLCMLVLSEAKWLYLSGLIQVVPIRMSVSRQAEQLRLRRSV